MAADHDVGAGPHQFGGERLLERIRTRIELDAPVEEDDHRVGVPAGRLDGVHEVGDVVGRGQTGLGGRRRPGRLQVAVDDLGGGDDCDPLSVDHRRERREGLGRVLSDPEDGVPGAPPGGDRHLQAGLSAVLAVVVGLGHERGPRRLEGVERRGGCVEVVGLRLRVRAGAVGHGRLEVDHREIGTGQQLRHSGAERRRRVGGQAVAERAPRGEVDVAAEGEGDRLSVALPVRLQPRVGDRVGGWSGCRGVVGGRTPSPATRSQPQADHDRDQEEGGDRAVPADAARHEERGRGTRGPGPGPGRGCLVRGSGTRRWREEVGRRGATLRPVHRDLQERTRRAPVLQSVSEDGRRASSRPTTGPHLPALSGLPYHPGGSGSGRADPPSSPGGMGPTRTGRRRSPLRRSTSG